MKVNVMRDIRKKLTNGHPLKTQISEKDRQVNNLTGSYMSKVYPYVS